MLVKTLIDGGGFSVDSAMFMKTTEVRKNYKNAFSHIDERPRPLEYEENKMSSSWTEKKRITRTESVTVRQTARDHGNV